MQFAILRRCRFCAAGTGFGCNEVKGTSMLSLARDLDVQYKTAFVLAHKLREDMAASVRGLRIGGEERVAELDSAYSAAMSDRRTWRPTGSTGGWPRTNRTSAAPSW